MFKLLRKLKRVKRENRAEQNSRKAQAKVSVRILESAYEYDKKKNERIEDFNGGRLIDR